MVIDLFASIYNTCIEADPRQSLLELLATMFSCIYLVDMMNYACVRRIKKCTRITLNVSKLVSIPV